ncbi:MAG TPA: hypothetical protein PK052_06780 [Anaerohalosphaeraceae bacterium]|nr:hypothetical protein [Anaerohalosphaeraceae bacterium]HOL31671.1 hypothetical protein [Anaerohalosphaeraceae bacterium]
MTVGEHKPIVGLRCPSCGCTHFYTIDSRPIVGNRIRRRRICRNCGRQVRTIERIDVEIQK